MKSSSRNITRTISVIAASALALVATFVVLPSAQANLTLPKGTFLPCSTATVDYCIEAVSVTPSGGKVIPLTWVATGSAGEAAGNTDGVAAGKALDGRWTAAGAFTTDNYDGLFIDAQPANDFVPWIFLDAKPTFSPSNNVALAALTTSAITPVNLNSESAITVKVRLSDFKVGVTFGVGTDATVDFKTTATYNTFEFTGYPVKVPTAKSSKDCTGNTGVATAVSTQFQTVIIPSNDPMGFTFEGSSGNLYVGSNGICKLSTPTWNEAKKSFSYKASAPRLAPDGTTVNTGFYYAVISFADAAALWGLTKPSDAATALVISVKTGAGGSTAATSKVSAKNNRIIIEVAGFEFPDPMLDISLNPAYTSSGAPVTDGNMGIKAPVKPTPTPKPSSSSKGSATKTASSKGSVAKPVNTTISCSKGKTIKKVTAVKPVCPAGYKKV